MLLNELSADFWIDDVTQWPPLEFPDLVFYLIESPGEYTREKLKAAWKPTITS